MVCLSKSNNIQDKDMDTEDFFQSELSNNSVISKAVTASVAQFIAKDCTEW